MAWQPPTITVKWGSFSKPDPAEEKAIVETVAIALGGGKQGYKPTITLRQGLQKIAAIFGTENVESALKELEKEAEENAKRELDAAKAAIAATGGAPGARPNAQGGAAGAPGAGGRTAGGIVDAR